MLAVSASSARLGFSTFLISVENLCGAFLCFILFSFRLHSCCQLLVRSTFYISQTHSQMPHCNPRSNFTLVLSFTSRTRPRWKRSTTARATGFPREVQRRRSLTSLPPCPPPPTAARGPRRSRTSCRRPALSGQLPRKQQRLRQQRTFKRRTWHQRHILLPHLRRL